MRTPNYVYGLLLMAVSATSIWHVLGKLALTHGMDASVFLSYRLLLSSALMLLSGRFVFRIPFVPVKPELRRRTIVIGLLTFVHSVCFLYGLQMTTPFLCAVLQPAVPVLVWLLSVATGAEKSNVRKAIGVVLCSVGAVGAAAASSHHAEQEGATAGTDFETGTFLVILSCVFYACHLVFQQPLLQAMPPLQVTGMVYAIAGSTMVIVTVVRTVFTETKPFWALSPDPNAWYALAFCVVFASAFTHGIYSWATKKVAATTVSVFITIEPITTTIVSLLITQAGIPSLVEAACAGIVAVGVVLVLAGGHAHTQEYELVGKPQEFELEDAPEIYTKRNRGASLEASPFS